MSDAAFPYEGPTELLPAITRALKTVVDPEVALDIVEVGLVYGVTVTAERVAVRLTMTSAACPVTDLIVEDAEDALSRALPGRAIHIELVWEPPWTPQRLSARARSFMGW